MEFDPELWLRIKNKKVTAHQMQILSEIAQTHSQTQAALNLGISVPVLHRHLHSLKEKLGSELIITSPNGTWLTDAGRVVLRIYNKYREMLEPEKWVTICCTPITNKLLEEALIDFEIAGNKYKISVNDDIYNLKSLYLGRADLVLFDDPNYAIEFEGSPDDKILTIDIYRDTLVHQKKGNKYIRYKFGAQRLGFRFLDVENKRYKILYEISNFDHLIKSGKSFFINQSLLIRRNIEIISSSDLKMLVHPIMAVSINPTEEIRDIVKILKKKAERLSWENSKH